ncbi:hypothetical protein KI688_002827 [Linnemannia hyalina]|uniref:Uncharacterized protein n=1 Tax=Linnemannia hyalina TaxID=64524 RepID=A0A9P8BQ55_9FUNG|nr:hypothetical protein KI688_002827 [Linnemannia hyalina]
MDLPRTSSVQNSILLLSFEDVFPMVKDWSDTASKFVNASAKTRVECPIAPVNMSRFNGCAFPSCSVFNSRNLAPSATRSGSRSNPQSTNSKDSNTGNFVRISPRSGI